MRVHGIIPQPTGDPRIFTLPSPPTPSESLILFRNGILQQPGEEFDLNGTEIKFSFEPAADDWMRCWYEAEN